MSRRVPNPVRLVPKKKGATARVYQLMRAEYALDDLQNRRVKASCFEDLNDPFELLGESLNTPEAKRFFETWKSEMNDRYRILCFSRTWSNPVLWSHYGDKHRGFALGFDVPENRLIPVTYAPQRLNRGFNERIKGKESTELLFHLLGMKFKDWSYEDEVRMFIETKDTHPERVDEGNMDFYAFGEDLQLREVIIGPRACVSNQAYQQAVTKIRTAIQDVDQPVNVVRTRLAFRSFKVVANRARQRFKDEEEES